jgi:hypothetical protein
MAGFGSFIVWNTLRDFKKKYPIAFRAGGREQGAEKSF